MTAPVFRTPGGVDTSTRPSRARHCCPDCGWPVAGNTKQIPAHTQWVMTADGPAHNNTNCPGKGRRPANDT